METLLKKNKVNNKTTKKGKILFIDVFIYKFLYSKKDNIKEDIINDYNFTPLEF